MADDLFADQEPPASVTPGDGPLAERLRPKTLSDVVGQEHLTGPDGAIGRMVAAGQLSSIILWGPPGTGKTTIARLLAEAVGLRFAPLSAVFSGVADLKKAFADAEKMAAAGRRTLLFVDEIHRFNRAQQDGFLPFVERGTVVLVGATTENPSFALNAALLSRAQVLVLHRLGEAALGTLIERAEAEIGQRLPVTAEARAALIASADGDGRFLLNQVETLFSVTIERPLDPGELAQFLHRRMPVYDKDRDGHYNLISALHKAMRGSDPQASLYWLARMLVAGEEPLYVLRRITRFASEDVGLADPQALVQCLAAKDAYQFLGSPEGELAIVQACLYCATAPKSNAAYAAQKAAWSAARETGSLAPPANILNAPTKLMKDLGYGAGYAYDHDAPEGFSGDNYWPDEMKPLDLYRPVDRGFEKRIAERMAWWDERRRERRGG
ncbi:replication-associated recombination protein A [Sphingopyxis sp.]|uniref:replication-associated recombination protein A n=1 Tax=Sphingopyxis sp. TaxID=1908224 RepID=UPI00258EB223|nr:replication-associated recombination protein A [Sphingopyxis sp.]